MFAATAVALFASLLAAGTAGADAGDRAGSEPGSTTTGTGFAGAAEAGSAGDVEVTEIAERRLADGTVESTIRMGPITMNAMPDDGDGHAADGGVSPTHGPDEPVHGEHTQALHYMPPPCTDCYITGVEPGLEYADGSEANYHTGAVLHHAVFFDRSRSDVTCGSWVDFAGRRIFATGNERTSGTLPDGYGVKYGHFPLTYTGIELMNTRHVEQEVYLTVTMTHVPADTPGMREVTPVWLDADNCGDSTHPVEEGVNRTHWSWTSDIEGDVVGAGGHIHDGGEWIALRNGTTGQELCTSEAGYGSRPEYEGHIESMTRCLDPELGEVSRGDELAIESYYHIGYDDDHAMSIMIAYIAEE